jgi:hypothetical protein
VTNDDAREPPTAPHPSPDPATEPTDEAAHEAGNEPIGSARKRNLQVTAGVAIALLLFFAIAGELLNSPAPAFVEAPDPFDDSPVVAASAREIGTPAPSSSSVDVKSE